MKKALAILGLITVFLFLVAAKYDYLLEMDEKTVKSSECNECHKLIYEEWSKDFHAKAFINDPFKKASNNYGMEECLACHAAQEIADENNLKIRPVQKEEGINCTTCHLKKNMIYGPYKLTAKHKSEQDESMLKSEFCAGCHMPTFQEWQASGSKKTCQECHMPRVERKAVQGFLLSAVVPKRMIGQHLQSYEKLLKEAALLTGEAGKGLVRISLTNQGGGHNMPTGKYGDYRIVLNTQVKDGDGKTLFSKEEIFSTLKKNGIPPQKVVTFEYPISFETGKRYKVNSNLLYQVEGRPEQSMASWSGVERLREENEMAFIHPIVILLAILSGAYTGYLGWKRFQFRRGHGSASDFPWKKHIQWGKRFYILLWIGFLIGVGTLFYMKGEIFTSGFHAYLAVLILLLFSIGVALGGNLSKGKGTNRLALTHMIINYSTFFFVLIQIILGVIFLTFFLAE